MQVSFNLSQIPKNMGGYRLGNLYLFFDNLSDELSFLNIRSREVRFPIKSESMLVLTLLEGTLHLKVNLQDVEVRDCYYLSSKNVLCSSFIVQDLVRAPFFPIKLC